MEHLDLVKKSKKGDGNSFSSLIKAYEKDLYRIAIAMLKNEDDALDCIQNTIMKAYKNINNLSEDIFFKTWLIKILINNCNDFLHVNKMIIEYLDYYPEKEYINIIDKLHIHNSIQKLDENLKLIILLYYFEDMKIKDISNSLCIPEGTVKSRLARARCELKRILEDEEKGVI